jgi:hypothetical protein
MSSVVIVESFVLAEVSSDVPNDDDDNKVDKSAGIDVVLVEVRIDVDLSAVV